MLVMTGFSLKTVCMTFNLSMTASVHLMHVGLISKFITKCEPQVLIFVALG